MRQSNSVEVKGDLRAILIERQRQNFILPRHRAVGDGLSIGSVGLIHGDVHACSFERLTYL